MRAGSIMRGVYRETVAASGHLLEGRAVCNRGGPADWGRAAECRQAVADTRAEPYAHLRRDDLRAAVAGFVPTRGTNKERRVSPPLLVPAKLLKKLR